MATLKEKLTISLGAAALFMLVNLPQTYKLTDQVLPLDLYNQNTNCPTKVGLLIHTIVFFLITFLTMGNPYKKSGIKLKHTIYSSLIFFLISSPAMYSLVGSVLGDNIADANGCPTMMGVLLHSAVYCAALVGVMYLPDKDQ